MRTPLNLCCFKQSKPIGSIFQTRQAYRHTLSNKTSPSSYSFKHGKHIALLFSTRQAYRQVRQGSHLNLYAFERGKPIVIRAKITFVDARVCAAIKRILAQEPKGQTIALDTAVWPDFIYVVGAERALQQGQAPPKQPSGRDADNVCNPTATQQVIIPDMPRRHRIWSLNTDVHITTTTADQIGRNYSEWNVTQCRLVSAKVRVDCLYQGQIVLTIPM